MSRTSGRAVTNRAFYKLATLLMVIAVLYFGKPVLVPLALSVLLAFILTPLVCALENWRLGRTLSVLMASGMAFCIIGLVFWGCAAQIQHLASDLPNHKTEIKAKLASLKTDHDSTVGRLTEMFDELFPSAKLPPENALDDGTATAAAEQATNVVTRETAPALRTPVVVAPSAENKLTAAVDILLPVIEPLASASLVIVLVIFVMLRREDVRYRLISLMGDTALTGTTRLMRDTADRVSKFLFHLLLVNAGFGFWFGAGLYFLDVPYAPLWGFLTFCFRFIPFLGAPASVLFPLLISIATSTGWSQPIWILVFFTLSELVTANVIEPVLFGKTTGLTPIALLIAALFWTWIWGPVGLLLSTPLTVCLVVMGQHLPHLRSLKMLLAEQPTLDPRLQYFQRLLAQDVSEGQRVFSEYSIAFSREQAFDEVIVPALNWTRRERSEDSISAVEESFIADATRDILEATRPSVALPNEEAADAAREDVSDRSLPQFSVFGYPVHHESEEIALTMLESLISNECHVKLATTRQLPSRVISEVVAMQPDVIVLLVTPPGGLPQVKYICSELSKRCPDSSIIITCLARVKRYDDLLVRLRKVGANGLATSLQQTKQQILSLKAGEIPVPETPVPDHQVIVSAITSTK